MLLILLHRTLKEVEVVVRFNMDNIEFQPQWIRKGSFRSIEIDKSMEIHGNPWKPLPWLLSSLYFESYWLIKSDIMRRVPQRPNVLEERLKEFQNRRSILEQKDHMRSASVKDLSAAQGESHERLIRDVAKKVELAKERNHSFLREVGAVVKTSKENSAKHTRSRLASTAMLQSARENFYTAVEVLLPKWREDLSNRRLHTAQMLTEEREKALQRRERMKAEYEREENETLFVEKKRRELMEQLALEQQDQLVAEGRGLYLKEQAQRMDGALVQEVEDAGHALHQLLFDQEKQQQHQQNHQQQQPSSSGAYSGSRPTSVFFADENSPRSSPTRGGQLKHGSKSPSSASPYAVRGDGQGQDQGQGNQIESPSRRPPVSPGPPSARRISAAPGSGSRANANDDESAPILSSPRESMKRLTQQSTDSESELNVDTALPFLTILLETIISPEGTGAGIGEAYDKAETKMRDKFSISTLSATVTDVSIPEAAVYVLAILGTIGSMILPASLLNGVVTVEKLQREYKRLGDAYSSTWNKMISHLAVITTTRAPVKGSSLRTSPVSAEKITAVFSNALTMKLSSEDRDRLRRKVNNLLMMAVLEERESTFEAGGGFSMTASRPAPTPAPTPAPAPAPAPVAAVPASATVTFAESVNKSSPVAYKTSTSKSVPSSSSSSSSPSPSPKAKTQESSPANTVKQEAAAVSVVSIQEEPSPSPPKFGGSTAKLEQTLLQSALTPAPRPPSPPPTHGRDSSFAFAAASTDADADTEQPSIIGKSSGVNISRGPAAGYLSMTAGTINISDDEDVFEEEEVQMGSRPNVTYLESSDDDSN